MLRVGALRAPAVARFGVGGPKRAGDGFNSAIRLWGRVAWTVGLDGTEGDERGADGGAGQDSPRILDQPPAGLPQHHATGQTVEQRLPDLGIDASGR